MHQVMDDGEPLPRFPSSHGSPEQHYEECNEPVIGQMPGVRYAIKARESP